jgi:hypothetical protein
MNQNDDDDLRDDPRLERLLRGLPTPPSPPHDLAQRIVAFATAQPQHRRLTLAERAHLVWDGLTADWPHGLAYKAAAMALVALVTFGSGIEQGFRGEPHLSDAELTAVIFGDLAGGM